MSRNYDNWERLVAAVIKREEYLQMCHDDDATTISVSSDSISNSSFRLDPFEKERMEIYERGVYVTLQAFLDGTAEIKRIQFSRRHFKEREAEIWWTENRFKIYDEYNARAIEEYEPGVYITLRAAGSNRTINIERVRFSRRKFKEHEAEAWWFKNRENAYSKYGLLDRYKQSNVSSAGEK